MPTHRTPANRLRLPRVALVALAALLLLHLANTPVLHAGGSGMPRFSGPLTNPFQLYDLYPLSSRPVLGDLDADGDLDMLFGTLTGGFGFVENSGTATNPVLTSEPQQLPGFSDTGTESSPTLADLDGDGDLDMVAGDHTGRLYFFENTGEPAAPSFAEPVTNPFGLSDVGTDSKPAFADLDGDGDLDALVGNAEGVLRYFENTGSATDPAFVERTGAENPFDGTDVGIDSWPAITDIDGDTDYDVVVGDLDGEWHYFENTGTSSTPMFVERTGAENPFEDAYASGRASPAFGDLDGDGDYDALVGNISGSFVYFENKGSATAPLFVEPGDRLLNPFNLQDVGMLSTPTLGDLNGDGNLDVLVGSLGGNFFYFQGGDAAAPQMNPFNLAPTDSYLAPTLADLDGDGDLDVMAADITGYFSYFENTGTASEPSFAAPLANPFGLQAVASEAAPTFGDLDGDGDLDAVMGNEFGTFYYYENIGTATAPNFDEPVQGPFGLVPVPGFSKPDLADLDGDGDLDVVSGDVYGGLHLFENTGTATAPAFTRPDDATNPFYLQSVGFSSAPAVGDLDGDGDLDLLVGEYFGNLIYYPNQVAPLSVTVTSFSATSESGHILVTWETGMEMNNQGFNLYRNTNTATLGERLNDTLIPSESSGGAGAMYEWHDLQVESGVTYYYWLEAVGSQGNTARYGPASTTYSPPTAVSFDALAVQPGTGRPALVASLLVLATLGTALFGWRRRR